MIAHRFLAALSLTACTYVTVGDAPDVAPVADTATAPDDTPAVVDAIPNYDIRHAPDENLSPDVVDVYDAAVPDVVDDACVLYVTCLSAHDEFACCGNACTAIASDVNNCGGCGIACPATGHYRCQYGECVYE